MQEWGHHYKSQAEYQKTSIKDTTRKKKLLKRSEEFRGINFLFILQKYCLFFRPKTKVYPKTPFPLMKFLTKEILRGEDAGLKPKFKFWKRTVAHKITLWCNRICWTGNSGQNKPIYQHVLALCENFTQSPIILKLVAKIIYNSNIKLSAPRITRTYILEG